MKREPHLLRQVGWSFAFLGGVYLEEVPWSGVSVGFAAGTKLALPGAGLGP